MHLSGAANRAGTAVIALHNRPLSVCWRFEHLHGFADATTAHIAHGSSGPVFVRLSRGSKLHHRGCVRVGSNGFDQLKNNAAAYYVTINSKQYPNGAVRGRM